MSSQITKHLKAKGGRHSRGLTLERFAAAKSSGYNKREKKDKHFALDAKKVNKYRKLKSKLQQNGILPGALQEDQHDTAQLRRIQERAGSPLADGTDEESELEDAINHQPQLPHAEQQQDMNTDASQPQPSKSRHCADQTTALPSTQELPGQAKRHKRPKPESHLQKLANQVQAEKEAALQERQAVQKEAAERKARIAEVEKQRKHQTTLLRKKTRTGQPVMKHRIDKILDALQQ